MDQLDTIRTKYQDSKLTIERADDLYVGCLELNGKTYTTTCAYTHKDQRGLRRKLLVAMLQSAALDNQDAFEDLVRIQQYPVCVFGHTLRLTDDTDEVECRGSRDPQTVMSEQAASSLSSSVTHTLTAFLNTNGGSLFLGVHDSLRTVHGISVMDVDKFVRRWQRVIHQRIQPRADHLIKIIPHPVVTRPTSSISELRRRAFCKQTEETKALSSFPPSSDMMTTYSGRLGDEYTKLLTADQPTEPRSQFVAMQNPVYVVQFLVLPASTSGLYFADHVAYRRTRTDRGANARLGPAQLEQYYFARFKQEHKIESALPPSFVT